MADFIDLVDKKKLIRNILRILDKHINASAEYPAELFEIKRELLKSIEFEQSFFSTCDFKDFLLNCNRSAMPIEEGKEDGAKKS